MLFYEKRLCFSEVVFSRLGIESLFLGCITRVVTSDGLQTVKIGIKFSDSPAVFYIVLFSKPSKLISLLSKKASCNHNLQCEIASYFFLMSINYLHMHLHQYMMNADIQF